MSKLAISAGGRGKVHLEVDRVVAQNLWKKKIQLLGGEPLSTGPTERSESLESDVHEIGNCMLLSKNFNISKSDKSLSQFLAGVHEFKTRKQKIEVWSRALSLDKHHVDPTDTNALQLAKIFKTRTETIQSDLEQFVRGTKSRIDVGQA
jgi:hypothetical protein